MAWSLMFWYSSSARFRSRMTPGMRTVSSQTAKSLTIAAGKLDRRNASGIYPIINAQGLKLILQNTCSSLDF